MELYTHPYIHALDYLLGKLTTDGEWVYALVQDDLHRFPLCGRTPAFIESLAIPKENGSIRYLLPTMLYSWNGPYSSYFSLDKHLSFPGAKDMRWIAGPSDGIFFFYSDHSNGRGLYGADETYNHYLEISSTNDLSYPLIDDAYPITLKEYPGINTEISRLEVIDGLLFVGTLDGIFHVFDLHTQEVLFRTRVNSPNFRSFHLIDDIAVLMMGNADVQAFKLAITP